jgi:trimeric autotransporter adhesin
MKTITNITYSFALFMLVCFALSPQARAVCQDGCGASNANTFLGDDALINNPLGSANTAIGFNALFSSTVTSFNTAIGSQALFSNTTSEANTAVGYKALFGNTTGAFNTATGQQALASNTTAFANTATGSGALFSNTTGESNTANGTDALVNNTIGSNNIALGYSAGENLRSGSNNICIGHVGVTSDSNTIRIGKTGVHTSTNIAGISGAVVANGVAVIVDAHGKLGTIASSAALKDDVKPMEKTSEVILALKPVTFRYKRQLDPDGIPQFGLVAEQVEKVNPDLVARDEQGKPYTVRYEAVNAMLLNEFLKARRQIDAQQKQIEALTTGLQKVSAQLEASKPKPQVVLNDQ